MAVAFTAGSAATELPAEQLSPTDGQALSGLNACHPLLLQILLPVHAGPVLCECLVGFQTHPAGRSQAGITLLAAAADAQDAGTGICKK